MYVFILHVIIFLWIVSALILVEVVFQFFHRKRREREELVDRVFTDTEWMDMMREAQSRERRFYMNLISNGWSPTIVRTRRGTHNWKQEGF